MKHPFIATTLLALSLCSNAQAEDLANPFNGTWSSERSRHSVFVGAVGLTTPFEDASDFQGLPPGSSSNLQNSAAVAFAYGYSLNDHFELQLQLATPFTADLNSTGSFLASAPTLGTMKILPPQAYILYNFQGPDSRLRTFVGAGFGYLFVHDETPSAEALALAGPDTRFDVSDGLFPAITFGAEQRLTDGLAARLQINYNLISVDTVLTSSALPAPIPQSVEVNPILVSFGLSYRF